MKAIIPVAGAGVKLRPHTYTQHKALIPLAGKPLLSHIIDDLAGNGVKSFVFIIGYLGEKIQQFVQSSYPKIDATFINQTERNGTAHAIGLAQNIIKDDEVVVVYGDTIVEIDFDKVLHTSGNHICVGRVKNPSEFGVVVENDDSTVREFVEKPKIPKSNLALVGMFKIQDTSIMFEKVQEVLDGDSMEEEYSFTMVLQEMLESGIMFENVMVDRWFDCGKKENILETNKVLLQKKYDQGKIEPKDFPTSIVSEPTVVGKNTIIENSIIGPYTCIGDNVTIRNSIISESIIGAYTDLDKISLSKSLIGSDVIVKGNNQELNIGDNTEIDLS